MRGATKISSHDIEQLVEQAQTWADEDAPTDAKSLFQSALCLQEASSGYYSKLTARIHYKMAWFFYNLDDNSSALTHFLQCLRIIHHLSEADNDDERSGNIEETDCVLDDIKDLLEHMQLPESYVDRVFDSWVLQDEAKDLMEASSSSCPLDHNKLQHSQHPYISSFSSPSSQSTFVSIDTADKVSSSSLSLAESCCREALRLVPEGLGLEKAAVCIQLARVLEKQSHIEESLGWYCRALMILPRWLSSEHPLVAAVKQESYQVARQLTPVTTALRRPGALAVRQASE